MIAKMIVFAVVGSNSMGGPSPLGPSGTITLATFNIHGGADQFGIVNLGRTEADIRQADADVLLLQEVHVNNPATLCINEPSQLASDLSDKYPYYYFLQTVSLSGGCGGFSWQAGLMLMSKYQLTSYATYLLDAPPGPSGYVYAQKALVVKSGTTFAIYNTHFSTNAHPDRQQLEAQNLATTIQGTSGGYVVMTGGDFNMTASDPKFYPLLNIGLHGTPVDATYDLMWSSIAGQGWDYSIDSGASDHELAHFTYSWCFGRGC